MVWDEKFPEIEGISGDRDTGRCVPAGYWDRVLIRLASFPEGRAKIDIDGIEGQI
ncbi:hypothetical protein PGB28_09060 [Primorskyibacter aestuariivivens]|uniref:hypothetical protein n=1 Tax=Primorskyibacter aestuariivivens TaxID=1888912 RepID=UPI002301AAC3|nr:hypothetical protein [Primorskyibacter aestuariivivens]MDA7428608.1 hypothetical protein [Primorskyibacter aestuariivivens]